MTNTETQTHAGEIIWIDTAYKCGNEYAFFTHGEPRVLGAHQAAVHPPQEVANVEKTPIRRKRKRPWTCTKT